jgi:hypothetical protein
MSNNFFPTLSKFPNRAVLIGEKTLKSDQKKNIKAEKFNATLKKSGPTGPTTQKAKAKAALLAKSLKKLKKITKVIYNKQKPPPLKIIGTAAENYQKKREYEEGRVMHDRPQALSGDHCIIAYKKCLQNHFHENPCHWKEHKMKINYKCGKRLFRDSEYKKIRLFWFNKIH